MGILGLMECAQRAQMDKCITMSPVCVSGVSFVGPMNYWIMDYVIVYLDIIESIKFVLHAQMVWYTAFTTEYANVHSILTILTVSAVNALSTTYTTPLHKAVILKSSVPQTKL